MNCKEQVSGEGGWHTYRCMRKAVRDGFCGIHHPDAVKARRAKSELRYQQNRVAEAQERNRRARETVDAFLNHIKGQVPRTLWSHLVHAVEKWDREKIPVRTLDNAVADSGVGDGVRETGDQ